MAVNNTPKPRQYSDQELAYFKMIADQQKAGTYNEGAHNAYLASVAKPNPATGAPAWVQNADPYQVNAGSAELMDAAQRDVWRQGAEMARQGLDFSKGQATGWVDGRRTMEGVKRDDDLRRNPMNAAIYEQERRGFRSGTGTGDPEANMYGAVGDETGGVAGGSTTPGAPKRAKKPKVAAIAGEQPKSAPRSAGQTNEAFYNANSGQYEFSTDGGGRFSVDKATGARLGAGDAGQNTRGTGDDRVASGNTDYNKGAMSRQVQDLNKRMGSMTAGQAQAFKDYDDAKVAGRMGGGDVEIPGYTGELDGYGFRKGEAEKFRNTMADQFRAYGAKLAARTPDARPSLDDINARFGSQLRDVAFVRDTAREVRNLKDKGEEDSVFRTPEWRQRLSRLNQILDIDIKGSSSGLFGTNNLRGYPDAALLDDSPDDSWTEGNRSERARQDAAVNFMVKHAQGIDPNNVESAFNAYNPDWYRNRDLLTYATDTPRPLKKGGQMTVGGAPHWIVNSMGKPVAALTEDGKDETVKGRGGVEVIPTDPARKANYLKRRGGNRPGAASGNSTKTLSGRTSQSKEVNARTKGAKAGDKRVNNGKTNNGRPRDPGSPPKSGVTDKDASGVRKAVRGPFPIETPLSIPGNESITPFPPQMSIPPMAPSMGIPQFPRPFDGGSPQVNEGRPGIATLPIREPNGAVMPYRPVAGGTMGMVAPVFQVPGRAAGGPVGLPSRNPYGKERSGLTGGVSSSQKSLASYNRMGGKGGGSSLDLAYRMRAGQGLNLGKGYRRERAPGAGSSTPAPTAPGMPAMDASGGNRIIGDATAPTARYGFDKNAPIDIAAQGATRGVKGMPGVQVAQPWKQGPRALLQRGAFGNQLLQSYWNATGAAPEDLADRGRVAAPRAAGSQRSFY